MTILHPEATARAKTLRDVTVSWRTDRAVGFFPVVRYGAEAVTGLMGAR